MNNDSKFLSDIIRETKSADPCFTISAAEAGLVLDLIRDALRHGHNTYSTNFLTRLGRLEKQLEQHHWEAVKQ